MSGCANCIDGYVTIIEDGVAVRVGCLRCWPEIPDELPSYDDSLYYDPCEHGQDEDCAICDDFASLAAPVRDYLGDVL